MISATPPRAMLLCAGLSSRLGALGSECPKPLLPVCDVPLVRYGLALLQGHGFGEVIINVHHLGAQIVAALAEPGGLPGPSLSYSEEAEILGTGGGIRKVADFLTQGGCAPCLVMNGKLITSIDLGALVRRHVASGALATMVVREVPDAERWGAVDLDGEDRVLRILGQGRAGQVARCTMFTGVHVLSAELVEMLPPGPSCIVRQGYLPALARGAHIEAVRYSGYFAEHSTPARYLEGNFAVLRDPRLIAYPPAVLSGADPDAVLDAGVTLQGAHRVARSAEIGARVVLGPDVVIGARARVAAGVRLTRVVVWPDAHVSEDLQDAVVTPRGIVHVEPVERVTPASA